jgi:hypothetical protein
MLDHIRWRTELARFESALQPIANRPVDISDPNWDAGAAGEPDAVDQAGVRKDAEALLLELLTQYDAASDAEREALRAMYAEFPSFAWAVGAPLATTARAKFRLSLLHFSLLDQWTDARDAVLWLDDVCRNANLPDHELKAIRSEVARISSNKDKYGFGSTSAMLLYGYGDFGRESAPGKFG